MTSKKQFKLVLAIETSCDDTSVALVTDQDHVVSMESQNQDDIHAPFGGVIPELACRNHTMRILRLLDGVLTRSQVSWEEIDGIAVTSKPGLLGSLLVGVSTAKSLALAFQKPLIGVNHLEGHLHAPFLRLDLNDPIESKPYPFVGLCVSGGHTSLYYVQKFGQYRLLGRTLDDAAGEAFDKFGKLLGLGYPAGHVVDRMAIKGNKKAFNFPRPLNKSGELNFSFSGLKTSGAQTVKKLGEIGEGVVADLCASYQEAIVDVLIEKLQFAMKKTKCSRVVVTGGVSANSRLRAELLNLQAQKKAQVFLPPLKLCSDNAAMIGYVGLRLLQAGKRDKLTMGPQAYMKVAEL
ncbi:MAG: tRNA (adenosine(37)-N6)-threonylcarbamoyltransferase complex transferase subunit TsaD [Oligoflexia bacterium]|nr:tRNA (adenosine(37)-N6)-threonylcarbamoyltransferase complex transferase subunit TsaD [Oligoflexia bacterium]